MSSRTLRSRPAALAAVLAFASLLSCGREFTGPGGAGRPGEVQLNPVFETVRLGGDGRVMSIGEVVDFAAVRVLLVRASGDTVVDRVVAFPPDSTSIRLAFNVTLSDAATPEGEPLDATLNYINATGDTVFSGGPLQVLAKSSGSSSTPPPEIPVRYVGAGADAAAIAVTPTSHVGLIGTTVGFTAVVTDSLGGTIDTVPVAFTSTDSARVRVDLRTGQAQLLGARGTARIIAQTLTGQADTASVEITPTASAILLVSGANQNTLQGTPFPLPVRVRVNAADAQPVAGVPVAFSVTRGQGSAAPTVDTTDANGIAEAGWTAGDSAGVGNLTATVVGTSLNVVVPGTQLSSAPTTLTFETQPQGIAAGAPLDPIRVVVRDAVGDTVRAYNGPVDITITGGTAGAILDGERPIAAVNGVITFTGLTVNLAGTNYRLVASISGGPNAQSNQFTVTPSLPYAIQLVSGGGQTVPPSTALPDSIAVRVVDIFGAPKAGVTVNFSVSAGGGSVSPANAPTDANGRAATRWTAGAAGVQQLTVTSGQLVPLVVSASVMTGGGDPLLFLPVESFGVAAGRTRPVTVFLTNPTPGPLQVDFAMRDTVAAWGATSLIIPSGGTQVTALISGLLTGSTRAVVSSAAGTDSMTVTVDSATAVISTAYYDNLVVGDTMRLFVLLSEPAPAGGLTVTVRSSDSASVVVAPGSGLGRPEEGYAGLVSSEGAGIVGSSGAKPKLLAPPAGSATITVAEGQLTGQLVVIAIQPADPVTLLLDAPGFATTDSYVQPVAPELFITCDYCSLAPGQYDQLLLDIGDRMRRPVPLRVRSSDPTRLVVVDSNVVVPTMENDVWQYVKVLALDTGTVSVVLSADGFTDVSTTITVRPRRFYTPAPQSVSVGSTGDDYIYAGHDQGGFFAYSPPLASPLAVTAVSRDPGVVALDAGSQVIPAGQYYARLFYRGVATGSTWIVYSAPGYPSDSIEVFVGAMTLVPSQPTTQLGVGLTDPSLYLYTSGTPADVLPVSVTSSAPGIVRVLTPTLNFTSSVSGQYVRVEGVSPGTATITFASPDADTATLSYTVVTPSVYLSTFSSPTTIDADSAQRGIASYLSAGGYNQHVADTILGVLRSTDPTVLVVTDSVVRFVPSATYSTGGVVRGIAPGTAQLILALPFGVSDTSDVVTVRPFRLTSPAVVIPIGTGLTSSYQLVRSQPPGSPLEVTFTTRGPSGSSTRQSVDTFPAGDAVIYVDVDAGLTPGLDTIFASAPGLGTDTIIVQVVRGRVRTYPPSELEVNETYDGVFAALFGQGFTTQATVAERRAVLVSRDTSVLRVNTDTLVVAPGSAYSDLNGSITGMRPGQAWLVVSSVDGTLDPDSALVQVTVPAIQAPQSSPITMAMQQETYYAGYYFQLTRATETDLWVKLQSSAPTVVSVPDSVLVSAGSYYGYLSFASNDTVGSAAIAFSAPGYVGASQRVIVSRGVLDFYIYTDELVVGGVSDVDVYASVPGGYSEAMRVPVPVRFVSADSLTARVVPDTTTIPAGFNYSFFRGIRGLREGTATISVQDARPSGYFRLVGSAYDAAVRQPEFYLDDQEYHIPVGFTTAGSHYAYASGADSLWVRIRALAGLVQVDRDSLLITADGQYPPFDLTGLAAGVDTLVLEYGGTRVATAMVRVGTVVLATTLVPTTIAQGDSVAMTVQLRTSSGGTARAPDGGYTVTFAVPASLEVRQGGATVTSILIPAGADQGTVHLRGAAVGSGILTIAGANANGTALTITTRTQPD